MKVLKAWKAGYTGKNISVTILDDGIEHTHDDLHANYDRLASKDLNSNDDDPSPAYTLSNENKHGTRCAGEVAAVANNEFCSVGIAYHASIGGVRMLDGRVTDLVEAGAIGLNPQHIDIYSASWGPDDDGFTVDGPAKLARLAFEKGVREGRNGKGSIFVWASGNGGKNHDDCNCDGYTDSIYTLSISSATQRGTRPWYSESCSSTLATTYSSGSSASNDGQIVTTDLNNKCTTTHTGTSASAPLAAGICALALEANGNLTWRDMQHLVVETSNSTGLADISESWSLNGVGKRVSHAFGFGMMDAYAMVTRAKTWKNVPEQRICNISVIAENGSPRIFHSKILRVPIDINACPGKDRLMDTLEHVQAQLTLSNKHRGQLSIHLYSPSNTKSRLLGVRDRDYTSTGFNKWSFMTTHCWGENPRGKWVLEIETRTEQPSAKLSLFNLILYGTFINEWKPDKAVMQKEDKNEQIAATSTNPSSVHIDERQTTENEAASNLHCLFFSPVNGTCIGRRMKF